jgi:hypothetical protein
MSDPAIENVHSKALALNAQAAHMRERATHADGQSYYSDLSEAKELARQARNAFAEEASLEKERNRQIRLIHVAQRDLAMDDDTYHLMCRNLTGIESSADMTGAQRRAILAELRRRGWRPRGAYRKRPADREPTQADKIRSLWIEIGKTGALRDRTERALGIFCRRMTGRQSPDWLPTSDANIVIEALKSWLSRVRSEVGEDK